MRKMVYEIKLVERMAHPEDVVRDIYGSDDDALMQAVVIIREMLEEYSVDEDFAIDINVKFVEEEN